MTSSGGCPADAAVKPFDAKERQIITVLPGYQRVYDGSPLNMNAVAFLPGA